MERKTVLVGRRRKQALFLLLSERLLLLLSLVYGSAGMDSCHQLRRQSSLIQSCLGHCGGGGLLECRRTIVRSVLVTVATILVWAPRHWLTSHIANSVLAVSTAKREVSLVCSALGS